MTALSFVRRAPLWACRHPRHTWRHYRAVTAPWPPLAGELEPRPVDRDRGFMLVEAVLAIVIVGALMVPMSAAVVVSLRASETALDAAGIAAASSSTSAAIGTFSTAAVCAGTSAELAAALDPVITSATVEVLAIDCTTAPGAALVELRLTAGEVSRGLDAATVEP